MTATEELRRLLDGRGATIDESIYPDRRFAIRVVGSDAEILLDNSYGKTCRFAVFNLTPAQAVEATLGRGTCHDTGEDEERFCCSECGSRSHIATEYRKFDEYGNKSEHFLFVGNPRFCPSCGRRVVDA